MRRVIFFLIKGIRRRTWGTSRWACCCGRGTRWWPWSSTPSATTSTATPVRLRLVGWFVGRLVWLVGWFDWLVGRLGCWYRRCFLLSVCLSVGLSACLSVCLSCLSACLFHVWLQIRACASFMLSNCVGLVYSEVRTYRISLTCCCLAVPGTVWSTCYSKCLLIYCRNLHSHWDCLWSILSIPLADGRWPLLYHWLDGGLRPILSFPSD